MTVSDDDNKLPFGEYWLLSISFFVLPFALDRKQSIRIIFLEDTPRPLDIVPLRTTTRTLQSRTL